MSETPNTFVILLEPDVADFVAAQSAGNANDYINQVLELASHTVESTHALSAPETEKGLQAVMDSSPNR